MRRSFPWFWVIQFFVLSLLGLFSLFHPSGILQNFRGYLVPEKVHRPTAALNSWVLGLDSIDPPNERVREFFTNHDDVLHKDVDLWTPDDPSLHEYAQHTESSGWRSPETINAAWEDVEAWLLSGRPAPPPEHREAIQHWIHAIDQFPEPSQELRRWIADLRSPQPPPKELRVLILDSDQVLPDTWRLAAQQIRFASPCILAAAFFTLLGLMTPYIRRPLARVFVLICLFWSVSQLDSSFGSEQWTFAEVVTGFGLLLGIVIVVRMLRAAPRLTAGVTLFTVIGVWWTLTFLASVTSEMGHAMDVRVRTNLTIASASVAITGIFNAWYWLIGKSEDPPQDNGGIVQRRPPQLWTLWVVQFLILFFTGVMTLAFPQELAELFIREQFDHLTVDVVDDSVRSLGAWIISMALFSFFALGVGRDWVWQGISVVFCVVFLLLALSTIHIASTGEYSLWIYAYGFQGLVFIPLTIILMKKTDPYSNANVERIHAEDWSLTDLLIAPLLAWYPVLKGRRAYYRQGVGAKGYMQVLPSVGSGAGDCQQAPPNAFFVPGRRLPIQMRFSNFTQEDDAGLDIRGCALRIGAGPVDRLDLLLATGEFSPFSTLADFQRYLFSRKLAKLIARGRTLREGLAAGMRRAPSSFACLNYFHQFILQWDAPNAENYLVRFRVVPRPDSGGETSSSSAADRGIPSNDDLLALWRQERHSTETRSPDYLRRELHVRLENQGSIAFQLEAQFHKPHPGDTLEWYNASIEWEARESPWLPLAELVLETPQLEQHCERQVFDPSRLPPSLSVPIPDRLTDLTDPRALASARCRIIRSIGRLRLWRRRFRLTAGARKPAAKLAGAT